MSRVFLGGTCNGSKWRETLIALLKVNYFNPVVDDWTPELQVEESRQKARCEVRLYVITPKMTGVYAIAEVVDDSNKFPQKTIIFVLLEEDEGQTFSEAQQRSLFAVANLVKANGARVLYNLNEVAEYLNRILPQQKNG